MEGVPHVIDQRRVDPHFEVNNMKKLILILSSLFFLIALVGCNNSNASEISMESPEATMKSYYDAIRLKRYDDFKRVFSDDGFIVSESKFSELSSRLMDHKITKNVKIAGSVSDSERRFIQIEVMYRGSGPSLMNYVLFKEDQVWKIESYNAVEDEVEEVEAIDKQIEDMFK